MTGPAWITTPVTAGLLRGALDVERTEHGVLPHRLPARARAQCSDGQLLMAESQPSGVRLAFRSAATTVELDALPTRRAYVGAPPRPDGVYDLLVDGRPAGRASVTGGGHTLTIDMAAGSTDFRPGKPGTVRFTDLPGGTKDMNTDLMLLRAFGPAVHPVIHGREECGFPRRGQGTSNRRKDDSTHPEPDSMIGSAPSNNQACA